MSESSNEDTFKSHLLPSSSQIAQLHDTLRFTSSPVTAVLSTFRTVVDQSPLELERYATEIRRLKETLARVKSDRALLQWYSDGCRSVFAPIRHLPTELLIEIFDLCFPSEEHVVSGSTSATKEENRVAKSYLLRLSRVCSHWHGIAMGTPRLWSSITADTWAWYDCSLSRKTLLGLVKSSLERSGGYPLNLQIAADPNLPDATVRHILKLIARYSLRWKNVCLWLDPHAMQYLLGAKGKLPLLENLTLNGASENTNQYANDVFSVAPRLKTVACKRWPSAAPLFPWRQLSHAKFSHDGKISLYPLPLLPAQACCELDIEANLVMIRSYKELTPVTSQISTLLLQITAESRCHDKSSKILGMVFDCLTLPRLTSLRFIQQTEIHTPLWNQTCFLRFVSQSMLRTSLTVFEMHAIIEENELQECLLLLPFLEKLRLWDCEEGNYAVITDTLLTWLDHTSIVPRLKTLALMSIIEFRDDSLWQLVNSRIDLRRSRSENEPFVVMVSYLPAQRREFSRQFLAQLSELEESGDLTFKQAADGIG
ncbi:hypothetical protein B0H12DRAFT_1328413 [Mycena haematopus]|nr:hypothetical protein B0H12DRAFT_1328413 [Mycena haematopus]